MQVKTIRTHFITVSDKLDDVVFRYVLPNAQTNDIIILCEKIVSIIQNRVVYKKDVKLSFWAKFLSKFAMKTPYGFSVGNPYKMQVAINSTGLPRILFASFLSGLGKLIGVRGIFYRVAGNQISQIDGFYGKAFAQYGEMGILGSQDSDRVCQRLKDKFGFSFAIADVNDLGGNIIGRSNDLKDKEKKILTALKGNPAGQSNQQTPIIILKNTN